MRNFWEKNARNDQVTFRSTGGPPSRRPGTHLRRTNECQGKERTRTRKTSNRIIKLFQNSVRNAQKMTYYALFELII